jgi:hypothetical protein
MMRSVVTCCAGPAVDEEGEEEWEAAGVGYVLILGDVVEAGEGKSEASGARRWVCR